MYKIYDYLCTECSYRIGELFKRGEQPETLDCEACGHEGTMVETIGAPMVLKASYPDGTKRGEKWQSHKEAAKLEQEAVRLRKRGDTKEASKLRKEASTLVKRVAHKKDTNE